jgi:endoglycosylceramidase
MDRGLKLACCLLLPLGCAAEPEAPRGWRVEDGFIRDADRRAVVMRGINLSGEHKAKPYLGFHTRADLLHVREAWGMNALRFVITWAAVEPERDRFDEEYLRKVEERLEWASEAGLSVVLDLHQDVYGEGFGGDGAPRWACDEALYAAHEPVTPWFANYASPSVMTCFDRLYAEGETRDRFVKLWRHLATRFARAPAIIGFEVLNEPHWGSANVWSFERDRLQPFYAEVVAAVREVAPGWLAFLEPASSRNLAIPTSLEPFAGVGIKDAVYAPHSYDAIAEGSGGFDPARRGALTENLAALAREARTLGAALWIGEYGGVATEPGIAAYMDASYDGAAAVAASTIYWEYTKGGYGVLDKNGAEQKELLAALCRPYPERVAGTPESYSFDESDRRFTLVLRPDPGLSGLATELAVPARVYPSGVEVSCGGCRVEESAGRVRLFGLAGERATVSLTPRP